MKIYKSEDIIVEIPKNKKYDLSFPMHKIAKELGMDPCELAKKVSDIVNEKLQNK